MDIEETLAAYESDWSSMRAELERLRDLVGPVDVKIIDSLLDGLKVKSDTMRTMHLEYRRRIGTFVLNRLTEVTNEIGGVTGYRLNLNAEETEKFIREIES